MERKGVHYHFSTGTIIAAPYGGVIGLGDDGEVYMGYDETLGEVCTLTTAEQVEMALYMTNAWWKVAERLADGAV